MRQVAISEFKAKCLKILDDIQKTKQPVVVTKRGKPVAEVVPVRPAEAPNWLGFMEGTGEIVGDIVSPVVNPNDFEVIRH